MRTRVIPGSDDGAVLYVSEPGSRVGKRAEHLVVTGRDGREAVKVPMHAARQVVLFGNVQVSTQALQTLVENDIPVVLLTGHGKFVGGFCPPPHKNVALREAQFARFADKTECLKLAKEAVRAKLTNQHTLLMRSLRGDGAQGSEEPAARGLATLFKRIDAAESADILFGLEGQEAAY